MYKAFLFYNEKDFDISVQSTIKDTHLLMRQDRNIFLH